MKSVSLPGLSGTYIAHSATRGKAAIDTNFPDGFPGATLVRDGWSAQTGTVKMHHQNCLAHLLRDLNYLDQKYKGADWPRDFRKLLRDAIGPGQEGNIERSETENAKIVQRLQKLLGEPPDKKYRELYTFYRRMCRERQNLFTFTSLKSCPTTTGPNVRCATSR